MRVPIATLGIALAAGVLACSSTLPFALPAPVLALPDEGLTREAILEAMDERGWQLERERPGAILAVQRREERVAGMWLLYDIDRVRFGYAGSTNYRCTPPAETRAEGQEQAPPCETIDSRYMTEAGKLRREVARCIALRQARLDREP